jgi:hypothetical protein
MMKASPLRLLKQKAHNVIDIAVPPVLMPLCG